MIILAAAEQNKYELHMPDAPQLNAALDPAFFEGRLLIDILAWDWNLRVAICSAETPPKSRFQGGLDYGRDFLVRGRVRAPKELRGRTIKVRLSPFGPKVGFGAGPAGICSRGQADEAPAQVSE